METTHAQLQELVGSMESHRTALATHVRNLQSLDRLRQLYNRQEKSNLDGNVLTGLESIYQTIGHASATTGLVLPALESNAFDLNGARLRTGLESISRAVSKAVDLVLAAIKKILALFRRFFQAVSPSVRGRRNALYKLRQQVLAAQGLVRPPGEIPLGKLASRLATETSVPANGAEITAGLNELHHQYSLVVGSATGATSDLAKAFIEQLASVKEGDSEQWAEGILRLVRTKHPALIRNQLHGTRTIHDSRWPQGTVYAGSAIPGQRTLVIADNLQAADNGSVGERFKALSYSGVFLVQLESSTNDPVKAKLPVMDTHDMLESLRRMDGLQALLEDQMLEGKEADIAALCRKLEAAVEKVGVVQDLSSGASRALSVASSVTNWLTNPYMSFTAYVVTVLDAHQKLLTRHLEAYKAGKV